MTHVVSRQVLSLTIMLLLSDSIPFAAAQEQDGYVASLNSLLDEDVKDYQFQSALTQLIKPACPTMLTEELEFPAVPVVVAPADQLKELWLQALKRPETDLRYDAVVAIARAHSRGMPGFEDTASRLEELLESQEIDHVLRLAVARTLIVLNAQQSAPVLRKHRDKLDLAKLIEPVLAEWNDAVMQEVWLTRLRERNARPGMMVLAMQAAAQTQLSESISPLREIMFDPTLAPHLRLEAARALGTLGADSNTVDAGELVSGTATASAFLPRLLAAHLLTRQDGDEAVGLLSGLAEDPQPATRAIALRRLIEIDPQLTEPFLDGALQQSDAKLRRIAGQALFELRTAADMSRLSDLLDDVHPDVRSRARDWMIESHADAALSESVRESAMQMLTSDRPRGLAQAAIVLGTVDHKPAADLLVSLLDHEAPDVAVASAWALRHLAVPETAEPAFEHFRVEVEDSLIERPSGGPSFAWRWDMYEQHKHIIELLGLLRYKPADELFRQFIPFPPTPPMGHPFRWIHCTHRRELRSRAIWALGRIHENAPDEELVTLLLDQFARPLEVVHVAAMCGLALGRMEATEAESRLREFYKPDMPYSEMHPVGSVLSLASRAALEQITGTTLPPMEVEPFVTPKATSWFLELGD